MADTDSNHLDMLRGKLAVNYALTWQEAAAVAGHIDRLRAEWDRLANERCDLITANHALTAQVKSLQAAVDVCGRGGTCDGYLAALSGRETGHL